MKYHKISKKCEKGSQKAKKKLLGAGLELVTIEDCKKSLLFKCYVKITYVKRKVV